MTKVTGMTNTEIDSNSAFDGTTFTVPSGQDGKYYIEGVVTGDYSNAGQDGEETVAAIYKNGSSVKLATIRQSSASGQNMRVVTTVASGMLDLSAGNTIELYAHIQDASGNDGAVKGEMSSLLGYKLIT
jgi:nickel-dependent lactate racemase